MLRSILPIACPNEPVARCGLEVPLDASEVAVGIRPQKRGILR